MTEPSPIALKNARRIVSRGVSADNFDEMHIAAIIDEAIQERVKEIQPALESEKRVSCRDDRHANLWSI